MKCCKSAVQYVGQPVTHIFGTHGISATHAAVVEAINAKLEHAPEPTAVLSTILLLTIRLIAGQ